MAYNHSTQETEKEDQFKASMGYISRLCCRKRMLMEKNKTKKSHSPVMES